LIIYLPNFLTISRIAMVPWLVVFLQQSAFLLSLVIFTIAGITDALDGYIAKKYNAQTKLGAILDPLADKALLVSAYVMLAILEFVPFWLVVTVVFRDFMIIGGYLIIELFFGSVTMQPLKISKVNTVVQIAFIVLVLVSLAWPFNFVLLIKLSAYLVFLTSVISGTAYIYIGLIKATNST